MSERRGSSDQKQGKCLSVPCPNTLEQSTNNSKLSVTAVASPATIAGNGLQPSFPLSILHQIYSFRVILVPFILVLTGCF